jgi:protoporphyrinogen oxidase
VGHQDIVDDIYALIRRDNLPLTLVGNSYRGVGISDVIYDARVEVEYLNLNPTKTKQ